jgi:hypothetical protein
MNKERLTYLLNQYFNDVLTDQENEELNNWYLATNLNANDFEEWINEIESEEQLAELFYTRFKQKNLKLHKAKVRTLSFKSYISVAAVFLIFMAFAVYLFSTKESIDKGSKAAKHQTISALIKPGDNKATLTLANGKVLELDDVASGKILDEEGLKITKTKDGRLLYEVLDNGSPSKINTITTPNGGQYQVVLSDGTRVWLNAASSLKYPTKFNGNRREVELSGEAYFEVSQNKNAPFVVNGNKQTITVLGTHFNVNAYQDEAFVTTTLLEGSVKVETRNSKNAKMLKPGQQSVLIGQNFAIEDADIQEAVAWKEGYFKFKDEDLHIIMKQIARWYDVEVVYEDAFINKRFGAYISRQKSIHEILNIMQSTKGIKFKIEGRIVKVMR